MRQQLSTSPSSHQPAVAAPPLPAGMDAVHLGVPLVPTALMELQRRDSSRVFVMANRSSAPLAEPLVAALTERGALAAPLCCEIGMGGGEQGLLKACDAAAAAGTDTVITIGGGAIHDAGKLVRLWLSAYGGEDAAMAAVASVEGIQRAARCARQPPNDPKGVGGVGGVG
jgi:alcohol dehydrogenase class IV